MTTLADFLATASPDTDTALNQARQHPAVQGYLIPSNTINHWLAGLGMTGIIQDIAADKDHPARHKMASLLLSITSGDPTNIILGTQTGDGTNAMLAGLIETDMSNYAAQLTAFRDMALAYANRTYYPFQSATRHDVLLARHACPAKSVPLQHGWLVITLTADCEHHAARITGISPRTGDRQVLGRIWLSKAGAYEFKVPTHYLQHTAFEVDDAYGAVE